MKTVTAEAIASGYRVDTARGVEHIDPTAWNRVARAGGGSVFHSWEWLAAFEDAPPGEFEPNHLLVHDGDELVGICPAYLVHHCPRLDYLSSLCDLNVEGPILLAHSLAAFAGGPVALPDHPAAATALLEAIGARAQAVGAWAWGFVNVLDHAITGRLLAEGYAVSQVATTYLVDSRFGDPAEFWRTVEPRRRRKFERDRRVAAARGYTVHDGLPDADTFVRLVHGLLAAHDTPTDVLPDGFLRSLRTRLAPYERSYTATDADGSTVAVFACWEFGGELAGWLSGLDTERLSAFEPYHPMMARIVEDAVVRGMSAVNLGRANGAQKRRYGARPAPLFLALRSSDRRRTARLHATLMDLETRIHEGTEGLDVVRRCC